MKKVIIVEDEPLTLVGIQSLIDWEKEGYQLVGTSLNGQDALEKIIIHQPDVVLTDLMMDKMNGFELMEQTFVQYPNIKFIVLSNYNDFDNVRKAMRLGAADYIFKLTVKSEELLEILNNVTSKLIPDEKNKTPENVESSHYVIHQNMSFNNIRVNSKEDMRILYLMADNSFIINRDIEKNSYQLLDFAINNILSELLYKSYMYDLFRYYDGMYVLVYNPSKQVENNSIDDIVGIFDILKQHIKSLFNISMSGVISEEFREIKELKRRINKFNKIKESKFFSEIGVLDKENIVMKQRAPINMSDLESRCLELKVDIKNSDFINARDKIIHILDKCSESNCKSDVINIAKRIYKTMYVAFQNHKINIDEILNKDSINMEEAIVCYDYMENIKSEIISYLDKYILYYSQNIVRPCRQEVNVARKYVRDNIEEDVSVVKISSIVGMSESRFSHMFKDETGENFTEYVIAYKIGIATRLLKDTDMRIGEISRKVGVVNQNYFSTQFKKRVGMSPIEYRKKSWQ